MSVVATASLDTAVGFLPGLRSYDQTSTLASIRAQTTILSGGVDLLTPPSHSRDLASAIPGAAHEHLPTAGHMLLQEATHAVTDAISRTIATRISTRSATYSFGSPSRTTVFGAPEDSMID